MPSGSTRRYVAIGALATVLGAFVGASPSQEPAQQRPTFRIGSSFVRVDAYPSKDGRPVTDLTANEFEVLEDGVPQKIESFEHVVIRPPAQTERVEVPSQRESLQAAANPRNRVFVVFLDTFYVGFDSTHRIKEPLINLLNRILGPDDLVGVMTPEMSASDVVLGRKTEVIERGLRDNPLWGRRSWSVYRDEREQGYNNCYPPNANEGTESKVAAEMIARKRERATLEAMQDLVRYLRTIRDERKAILVVSEGWTLFTENQSLLTPRKDPITGQREPVPGKPPIYVGPGNGKLTMDDDRNNPYGLTSKTQCDGDRMMLANINDQQFFRDMMEDANAGNASFYPLNPRGLDVFDEPMLPSTQQKPLSVDMGAVRTRNDVLKTLADNTDGLAVVDTNNLEGGLRRISDDLSSYYLLGYSSTNTKMDGRFRALKVRVTRPGVSVRARRGYRSPTREEMTNARKAADAPVPDATLAVTTAISRLGSPRSDLPLRINVANAIGASSALWVAGELVSQPGRPDEFAKGGTASVEVTVGSTSTSAEVVLKPGEKTFMTTVPLAAGATGDVSIRARVTPEGGGLPYTDMLRMPAPSATSGAQPLFFKRGVTTGNRWLPAADLRFSRTERIRLEWPVGGDVKAGTARLLDKAGQPLQIPVTVAERVDEAPSTGSGQAKNQKWITAELALAALSNADYALELEIVGGPTTQRVVAGVRVAR